jgi:hypothetical protein
MVRLSYVEFVKMFKKVAFRSKKTGLREDVCKVGGGIEAAEIASGKGGGREVGR